VSSVDLMQQSNDAYRRQVDLEHWQRRSGVDSAFRDGWMRAPGNVIGKKLVTTYMEYLKEIAVQSRFRAGKYGHLNQYIDNDEALEIGAGVVFSLLLGSPFNEYKASKLEARIGAGCEYERWLRDPYWKNSYHLKGLGIMCAGDLGMSAIKQIMLDSKFRAAVEHYKPMEPVEKRAIGRFFLDTFCEATKMATIKERAVGAVRAERWVEYTALYYDFLDRWKGIRSLFAIRNMPMLMPPKEWTDFSDGGYQTIATNLVKVEREFWPEVSKHLKPQVIKAVNKLQAQSLVIDPAMVELVIYCHHKQFNVGGLLSTPPMKRPIRLSNATVFARQMIAWKKDWTRRGERSNYVQWRVSLSELSKRQADELWFVHYMDRRGRIYAKGGQVGYQGADYKRQSLSFPEEGPVKGNEIELMYGVSQAAGQKGLWGTPLIQWFGTESEKLAYCGADPEGTIGIWSGMKEPWRYIRLAMLWHEFVADPGITTGIPFQLDQSTSGYGHVACLTRDAELARITNVIGNGYGDLYSHMGEWAMHVIRTELEKEEDSKKIKCYQWWLQNKPGRKLFKAMFMPLIYGAGYETVEGAVADYMRDEMQYFTENGLRLKDLSVSMASAGWQARRLVLPGVEGLSKWLRMTANLMIKAGVMPHWVTPMGLRVASYQQSSEHAGTLGWVYRGRQVSLAVTRYTGPIPSRGMAADFVHSYDSAFLQQFVSSWPYPMVTVHDCFASTIDRVAIMRAELRDQWSRFYCADHLSQFHGYVSMLTGCNVPPPPRVGTLQSSAIGENHWLFS